MIGFPVLSIFWILSRRPLSFGFFVEISAGECIKQTKNEIKNQTSKDWFMRRLDLDMPWTYTAPGLNLQNKPKSSPVTVTDQRLNLKNKPLTALLFAISTLTSKFQLFYEYISIHY